MTPSPLAQAQALAQKQRYFDALMLFREGRHAGSEDEAHWLQLGIDATLALRLPEQAESMFLRLGPVLQEQDRLQQTDTAAACYQQALLRCPQSASVQLHAGVYFFNQKQWLEAERCYREAIRLDPSSAAAWNNLANLLKEQQLSDAAYGAYKQALAIQPLYAEAHSNLGNWYKDADQNEEAEFHYRRAVELKPHFIEGLNNYAVFLQKTQRHEESIPWLERALQADPNYAPLYLNLGGTMMNLQRHAEAETHYRKALSVRPGYAEAEFNLAMCLIMQGRRREGWEHYEARFDPGRKIRMTIPPTYPFPRWQNELLTGKTLLVYQEQGIGDQLMFARYLQTLKQHTGVARIVLVCHRALHSLFTRLDGVDVVAGATDAIPWCDYWTFILSLPLHLQKADIHVPTFPGIYISARQDQINELQPLMDSLPGLKVGLAWKGSTSHANDGQRSPGINAFAPLLSVPGVHFFSLLPDSREEFLPWAGEAGVDLGHELDANTDRFEETTALVKHLDLVIACDTSIAHVAGAQGKSVWLLLPFGGEWRWKLHSPQTDWYPGHRLFWQDRPYDWSGVFVHLTQLLTDATRDPRTLQYFTPDTSETSACP